MADIDIILNNSNPAFIAKKLAENAVNMRIRNNITQAELAEKSGVTLSSLKRFEQKAEISLANLLRLAVVLGATEGFGNLFTEMETATLDDYLKMKQVAKRKRVRKK